jgi:hypothetical protein
MKFTIRDLLWLTVVVAIGVVSWLEHSQHVIATGGGGRIIGAQDPPRQRGRNRNRQSIPKFCPLAMEKPRRCPVINQLSQLSLENPAMAFRLEFPGIPLRNCRRRTIDATPGSIIHEILTVAGHAFTDRMWEKGFCPQAGRGW